MKKLISLLLILALLAGFAVPAAAAEDDRPLEGKLAVLCTGNIAGNVDLYPRIKAAKDWYESQGAEVILVDAGNFMRGTAWVNADRGASAYELMDAVGYDVVRLAPEDFTYTDATTGYGYHKNFTRYYTQAMLQDGTEEIVYYKDAQKTIEALLPAREGAGFAAISSEFTPLKEGVYSFEPWHDVVTASGKLVRFKTFDINWVVPIAEPEGRLSAAADNEPTPVEFLQDGFLAYSGTDAPEPADYRFSILNACPVEAGNYGGNVLFSGMGTGPCVVRIEEEGGRFGIDDVDLDAFEPDPEIAALVEAVKERTEANPEAQVLFTSGTRLEGRDSVNRRAETLFGDVTTDALVWYAQNYIDGWNKNLPLVAIQNGGNLDDFLYPGEVTGVDLLRALPFSPMGVGVIELSGAQLLETLEAAAQNLPCPGFAHVSGIKYTVKDYAEYDAGEAYGSFFRADSVNRVEIEEIWGQPFDPEATYAVVADNFLMNGNDTYYTLKDAKDGGAAYVNNGGGVKVRDIFALYVKNELGGVVTADAAEGGRITVKDHPFTDVPDTAYYRDAVVWALKNEITTGTSDTTFGPRQDCTRAQVVTFLWRACGEPEPTGSDCPFTDVKADSFYYKAMLWAVEKGITTGASATTFAPNKACTRAQVVTFLWRACGEPEPTGADCPFTDVKADGFYYTAMLWAVENGITTGASATTFAPGKTCTRAQVVTFLWRSASQLGPVEPAGQ